MKHHLPPLDSLKVFESAARNLSFSRAAEELCLSKGAVSYQIKKLEEFVQASLFLRAVRQVSLTDDGKRAAGQHAGRIQGARQDLHPLQG